jgi:hypothetical protein
MSFDLGVWYSDAPMTRQEASAFYHHINGDWVVVRRNAEFDAFFRELLARFPDRAPGAPLPDPDQPPAAMTTTMAEIMAAPKPTAEEIKAFSRDFPRPDNSPWAAGLVPEGSAIALSISWSRVGEVAPVVQELAERHGLVFYDPQSGEVALPPALQNRAIGPRTSQDVLTVRIDGSGSALDVRISLGQSVLLETTMASRQEAHRRSRALALANGLPFYQVDDPKCLAQAMKWVPVPPDDPMRQFMPQIPGVEILRLTPPDEEKK